MFGLAQGLRHTFRQLAKSPVFTAVSILTIALGMGANTAIFSVMNAVLLQTLPVPNPQQLVYFHLKNQPLNTSQTGYGDMSMSMPVFAAMRTRKEVFQDVIGFAPLAFEKVAVRIAGEPEEVWGEMVSGNFFTGLGVQPVLGRGFTLQDESTHASISVLSYAWWKGRFGGDQEILGKTVYIKGIPVTVIGVAPPGFGGVDPAHRRMDFWIPLQNRPELNAWGAPPTDHTLYGSPNWLALDIVSRLQPGVTAEQAAAQLTPAFQNALASASPVDPRDQKPLLVLSNIRGVESLRDDYELPLRFLMSMVGLVLLIACANVVMLMMARNAGRLPEFCLRQALGANRRALFLQLFQESVAAAGDPKVEYTIVGVAGNSRYTEVREADRPMAYLPFSQTQGVLGMQYELHTMGDPKMLIGEAAKLIHDTDSNLPLEKPMTQADQFAETISRERLIANLSVFFAGLAGFLVAIGLYGTMSYGINRRTMEIGVRMALGAQRREVLRMVLAESLTVTTLGLALGIPASLAVARTLRSMMYGLSPNDPLSILLALAGIAAVTLAAAIFPARRAASIDPMRALRME